MIIDCVSDLHGFYPELEGGDLLIVAGDMTRSDTAEEHLEFIRWISESKYEKVIFIAGNHDNALENYKHTQEIYLNKEFPSSRWAREIVYLLDSGTEFEGLKIWGSPWTKSFPGMNPKFKAFTLDTEEELAEKWHLIPDDIDILITHSPPYDILDVVKDYTKGKLICCGSQTLLIKTCLIKPKLHIFGHIHEGYGEIKVGNSTFMNASHVNEYYEPCNKPIRIVL